MHLDHLRYTPKVFESLGQPIILDFMSLHCFGQMTSFLEALPTTPQPDNSRPTAQCSYPAHQGLGQPDTMTLNWFGPSKSEIWSNAFLHA